MPDRIDRLKTALADRYVIQEELGAGGMATAQPGAWTATPGRPNLTNEF